MSGGPSEEDRRKEEQIQRRLQSERNRIANEREERLQQREKIKREQDLAAGRARGEELFGEQATGQRAGTETQADLQSLIERRKQEAEGLTAEERAAFESQALGGIGQQTQGALRQLRGIQGASGVRGGLAAAQQQSALEQGARQQAEAQRDIFLQNIGLRRQGLGSLEQTLGAEAAAQERAKQARLATEFGFAGLGAAERGGVRQQVTAEQLAQQAAASEALAQGKK